MKLKDVQQNAGKIATPSGDLTPNKDKASDTANGKCSDERPCNNCFSDQGKCAGK